MAYTPREIKDRVAVGDDIFIVEDLGGNKIRLIPSPTHVSEAGTPVNKALLQPMENHMGDVANPHATTKEQVGLGSVQNYGIATKAQAEAGTANNVYMTPLRVAEAINAKKQIEIFYETTVTIEPNPYEGVRYAIPNATPDMILMASVNAGPYPVVSSIQKYGNDVMLEIVPTRSEGFDREYTVDIVILRLFRHD